MYYIKQNRNSEHVCLRSTLGPWLDCDVTLQFTSRAGGGSCVPWRSERRAYCLVGIGVDSKLLPAKVTWLLTFPKQFDPDLTDDKETSWCSLGSSLDWRRGNLWPLGRQLGLEKLKKNIYIYICNFACLKAELGCGEDRERQKFPSAGWFPQARSQESRTQHPFPAPYPPWVAEIQVLELPPRVCISRKQELETELGLEPRQCDMEKQVSPLVPWALCWACL